MARACFKPKSQQLWYGVYAATRRIPRGHVATYADLACAVGCPRAWRRVGTVLGQNRDPKTPCHRVVRSDGRVGGFGLPGGTAGKIKKLLAEGVEISAGRISLPRYRIHSPKLLVVRH
ncbi:MAG: MGMT family protein [Candidatus Sungbacteria bacterium]|uniref:MGMT family protein n=1 Tax=Candidatus Sungiibacteriota bacterium TaxID=2750080 RepID=A0A933DSY0_9BACT|nr:MGMT family protein [Candidatus Sungbacteria bacterium]